MLKPENGRPCWGCGVPTELPVPADRWFVRWGVRGAEEVAVVCSQPCSAAFWEAHPMVPVVKGVS